MFLPPYRLDYIGFILQWVFTVGLSVSFSVDFLITVSLIILLHNCRTGAKGYAFIGGAQTLMYHIDRLNQIIDSLILYAFEAGAMTL